MELIDVLRHSGQPRTEYSVDIPDHPGISGTLRLEIHSPIEVALSRATMTEQDLEACREGLAEAASMLDGGDAEGAANRLLDLVKEYPYYAPTYEALADLYWRTGNAVEAEYNFKQLIALDSSFRNIMRFGKFLGSRGRLDEARLLESYLWEHRAEVQPDLSLEAVHDYLVTLSRIPDPTTMISVCREAMAEYGGETTLVYQWIYAYVLAGEAARAVELLDDVIPKVSPTDRLLPRFEEMRRVAVEMASGQQS